MPSTTPIIVTTYNLRSSGPRMDDSGNFILQTFGVEKSQTAKYCQTTELRNTIDMQAQSDRTTVDIDLGPFKTVNYQSKRRIVNNDQLQFEGTEQVTSIFCDVDETEDSNCDDSILI